VDTGITVHVDKLALCPRDEYKLGHQKETNTYLGRRPGILVFVKRSKDLIELLQFLVNVPKEAEFDCGTIS
jgi:hypothetical protein